MIYYFNSDGSFASMANDGFSNPKPRGGYAITSSIMHEFPIRLVNGLIAPDESAALESARALALKEVALTANKYQAMAVGTTDEARETRLSQNLICAKAYVAGSASDAQIDSLQMQLDANIEAKHQIIRNFDLLQFANWIVEYDPFTTRANGLIESQLIAGNSKINTATSAEEVKLALSEWQDSFLIKFNGLVASTLG